MTGDPDGWVIVLRPVPAAVPVAQRVRRLLKVAGRELGPWCVLVRSPTAEEVAVFDDHADSMTDAEVAALLVVRRAAAAGDPEAAAWLAGRAGVEIGPDHPGGVRVVPAGGKVGDHERR